MAITKVINSESQAYRPVLTDTLVLDAVPTVNSFNGVTSDAVARAIAGASGEVPVVTENDNGKVLKAIYDEGGPAVEWAEAPSGVPEYSTSEDGKVLGVVVDDSGDTPVASLDWVDQPANELPEQLGTAGQVLTVNAGATGVEWATPSGGGSSYSAGSGIAINSNTISAKTDGTTITNNKTTWSQVSSFEINRPLIQDSCDNTSSLLIGPSKYDSGTGTYVLDWTLSLWRYYAPSGEGFYRLDLQSDSTWVLPSGWGSTLNNQRVKLYAASTDGTNMGTPIPITLYKTTSTAESSLIVYDNIQGTTLPRYVYVYLTAPTAAALSTCNTLNFGVDRYGVFTMLTAKPTGASLGSYWAYYTASTGQLGLYDAGSNEYDVRARVPKSYKGNITWGPMYDVPDVTSSDNGKVLTASYSGGAGSYAWVEQTSLPPYDTTTDVGKVLTVNNAGAAEWATPSGGSSFTLTKVGTVTTYLPESGSLSLTFATMSPEQSNFIDPTKLYILKVDVSCVDSGGLSFGSAPYFALTSYNTEYNAVNRTHLSYAFPQIGSYSMSSSASTNTPVYFFNEVANSLHIAPTGGQENDLKIEVGGVNSESYHSHRLTVDLYMVN